MIAGVVALVIAVVLFCGILGFSIFVSGGLSNLF